MRDLILKLVHERPGTTFVELCREIPGFAGKLRLTAADYPNVVLWGNVSAEAIDAINQLQMERTIYLKPTLDLTYRADGEILRLPIAKGFKQYKSPRWLPVVLNIPTKSQIAV